MAWGLVGHVREVSASSGLSTKPREGPPLPISYVCALLCFLSSLCLPLIPFPRLPFVIPAKAYVKAWKKSMGKEGRESGSHHPTSSWTYAVTSWADSCVSRFTLVASVKSTLEGNRMMESGGEGLVRGLLQPSMEELWYLV